MQLIIYKKPNGGIAIVVPSPEALELHGVEAIALKDVPGPLTIWDVPTGAFAIDPETGENREVLGPRVHKHAFKIVDASTVPSDRTFRNAWEINLATLTDGYGAESNEFPKEAA